MIGLDTNVIIRYLTQDDPLQAATATKLVESLTPDAPGFVSTIVVIELTWVLQSSYRVSRREIASTLETLLRSKELVVERAELIWQALRRFNSGNGDFADCLIERCGNAAGCLHTLTFDKRAATIAGMQLVG
jgi:predicted nucleic-acid-binding protein